MTLAQIRNKDSDVVNSVRNVMKGASSESSALLQEGKAKSSKGSGVAEMPEEMVGLDGELTLPEQGSEKMQDTRADQGVAMLQHADQIIQTGELFEEEAPLSQFKE